MTQAFNLSQFANNVNTSGQASLTAAVSGTLPVANGGTGTTSLTANNVILGNGTSAVQAVAPSTSGNVLTSNGTTWVSSPGSSYAGFSTVVFTSSTTWAVPTGVTKARITVIGGGGGGANSALNNYNGGAGGIAIAYCTGISGTLTITVGTGGAAASGTSPPSTAGGTSSVTGTGVSLSATGGLAVTSAANAASGVGTVTTGVDLKSGGGVQNSAPVAGNGGINYDYYLGGSIASAKNLSVSNTIGGAGLVFSVSGSAPAGVGGFSRGTTKSCGGVVIIEY